MYGCMYGERSQALADFWSLEKQRFEAMELHLIEQARQHKTVASGRLVDSGADDWNAIGEASPYLTLCFFSFFRADRKSTV